MPFLIDALQPEEIIRHPYSVELVNIINYNKSGERYSIKIPLDDEGKMLIYWAKDRFEQSFAQDSVVSIYNIDEIESLLFSYVNQIA